MKFGLCLPNAQGAKHVRDLVELAQEAESLGFNSVWSSEHLFHTSYVEKRLGSAPYHEALTILIAAATVTSTIRLGTSVLVLPWHHPVRLGKMIASLDDLSAGRVNMGVGVAITEDEYENLNIDFHNRGDVTNDMLGAMRSLWSEDFPEYTGSYFTFSNLRFEPKPVQSPLPVYVGGNSIAALKRLKKFGQAWHPLSICADDLSRIAVEHQLIADGFKICPRMVVQFLNEPSDRPLTGRKTLKGTPGELKQMMQLYAEAGVSEMILNPLINDMSQMREHMHQAKEVFVF